MKAKVITIDNKASGEITLSKDIFGRSLVKEILMRVVRWQLAKKQAGTHKAKTISEISGTTAKPFRQKGTGNARQGSKRSAQMRGGAIAHGPVVRTHAHKLPKAIRKLGLKIALSAKHAEGNLIIIKDAKLKDNKTKTLNSLIKNITDRSALLVEGEEFDNNFKHASANIKNFDIILSQGANVYDILRKDFLILTEAAVKKLEERLA